jgi:signal transduction histidine kinase
MSVLLIVHFFASFCHCSLVGCHTTGIPRDSFQDGEMIQGHQDEVSTGIGSVSSEDHIYTRKIDSLNQYLDKRNTAFEAHILYKIGAIYYRNFNFTKGLEYANEVLAIGKSLNDETVIIKALRLFADNYYAQAHYELSTDYFLKMLEYYQRSGNDRKIAEVYCNIGVNYEERGLLEKGMFYYLEALKIYEKIDDKEGIVASLCNLSFVYRSQGKNEEAIKSLEKANVIDKQYLDSKKGHYYMANIADAYKNMGQYKKALSFLSKGENILKGIKIPDDEDLRTWVDISKTQADIYLEEGNYDKAYKKYNEALGLSRKTNYPEKEGKVVVAFGRMLMKSGDDKKAASYLKEGLEIAEETGSYYLKKDVYGALAQMAAKQKQFRKAWEYQQLHDEMSDSVINIESARQLANFQAKYETEKKESQIQLLKKEKEIQDLHLQTSENQKTYLIIIAIMLLTLSGIVFNRLRLKKRTASELSVLNATKDKFFAIIAHDLKNPISAFNNIAQQVNTHLESLSADDLKYYIAQLSNTSSSLLFLLKNLLEWSRSQRGQLHPGLKEINTTEIIKNTIKEESNSAQAKNIKIQIINTEKTSILSDGYIIGTVLRNLLGNAIKFSPEGCTVKVETRTDRGEFIFSVSDQGQGLTSNDIKKLFRIEVDTKTIGTPENKGTGIGLIVCYEFLKEIGGRIWVESQPKQGSIFSFAIPLQNNINTARK